MEVGKLGGLGWIQNTLFLAKFDLKSKLVSISIWRDSQVYDSDILPQPSILDPNIWRLDHITKAHLTTLKTLNSSLDPELSNFSWKVGIIPSWGNSRNWGVMEEEGVWKVLSKPTWPINCISE